MVRIHVDEDVSDDRWTEPVRAESVVQVDQVKSLNVL